MTEHTGVRLKPNCSKGNYFLVMHISVEEKRERELFTCFRSEGPSVQQFG
jgi:hypothetical protein